MAASPLPTDSPLLRPVSFGAFELPNRVLMAPMTRNRAQADGTPSELMATYYAQRADAGLIIAEGSQPSQVGQAYPNTPGLHSDEHRDGWSRVAKEVHNAGGRIVVQVMHGGRISHVETSGSQPVSATATTATGELFTANGSQPFSAPRALHTAELSAVAAEYAEAAALAVDAGLDGVELHAANGYLLHQFLADGVNDRTDEYGGSPENRARFVVEVARAVVARIGADRVGIRISPAHEFNDITEQDLSVYRVLVEQLAELDLAYLHVLAEPDAPILAELRQIWPGTLILNTGFGHASDPTVLDELIRSGVTDAVAVGRPYLANPDLLDRWRTGTTLNEPDQSTIYGGDEHGYTDYPRHAA